MLQGLSQVLAAFGALEPIRRMLAVARTPTRSFKKRDLWITFTMAPFVRSSCRLFLTGRTPA
jgi:hypothetical protein